MNQGCQVETFAEVFHSVCRQVESWILQLESKRTTHAEHGPTEVLLRQLAAESLKRPMQFPLGL